MHKNNNKFNAKKEIRIKDATHLRKIESWERENIETLSFPSKHGDKDNWAIMLPTKYYCT